MAGGGGGSLAHLVLAQGFIPDDAMRDLRFVLEAHGLPPISNGLDAICMQGALFELLYGDLGHTWGD